MDRHTTLVIYMGLATLPEVSRRLVSAGLASDTPAVAIERGTLPAQRAVFAPLAALQQGVATHGLRSPTLIVIGDVVSLAPGWAAAAAAEHGISAEPVGSSGRYLQLEADVAPREHMADAAALGRLI